MTAVAFALIAWGWGTVELLWLAGRCHADKHWPWYLAQAVSELQADEERWA